MGGPGRSGPRRFLPPWSIIRLAREAMFFPHFVGDTCTIAA